MDSNYSSAISYDDSERFKVMFPDLEIAKNYQQGATKINNNIPFGIAPYIKESLLYDVSNAPFFSSSMKQRHRMSRSIMMLMLNTGRKSKTYCKTVIVDLYLLVIVKIKISETF